MKIEPFFLQRETRLVYLLNELCVSAYQVIKLNYICVYFSSYVEYFDGQSVPVAVAAEETKVS